MMGYKRYYAMSAQEQADHDEKEKAEARVDLLKAIDNAFEAIYELQSNMRYYDGRVDIKMAEYAKIIQEAEIQLGLFEKEVEAL